MHTIKIKMSPNVWLHSAIAGRALLLKRRRQKAKSTRWGSMIVASFVGSGPVRTGRTQVDGGMDTTRHLSHAGKKELLQARMKA
jgi:hypothetical protein